LLVGGIASALEFGVEDVSISKKYSNAWGIVWKIRNKEKRAVKGYVKGKLLNKDGDVIYTFKCFVNDGDPLDPGQAGPFGHWTAPENFTAAESYNIQFIEQTWECLSEAILGYIGLIQLYKSAIKSGRDLQMERSGLVVVMARSAALRVTGGRLTHQLSCHITGLCFCD
jgi:hypothetical protein